MYFLESHAVKTAAALIMQAIQVTASLACYAIPNVQPARLLMKLMNVLPATMALSYLISCAYHHVLFFSIRIYQSAFLVLILAVLAFQRVFAKAANKISGVILTDRA